jgi:sugar lactone lactonase YvrE
MLNNGSVDLSVISSSAFYRLKVEVVQPPTPTPEPTPQYQVTVTTLAGSGSAGSADGQGTAASFYSPAGITVDESGNAYVSDIGNPKIRKINSRGFVTTLMDAEAVDTRFTYLSDVTAGSSGDVYVVNEKQILKITSSGDYITSAYILADSGFFAPWAIGIDSSGSLYVSDYGRSGIFKLDSYNNFNPYLIAGSGGFGSYDGSAASASFNSPFGVAVDTVGNVYVADRGNNKIRKITLYGLVTTIAGSGVAGSADGIGTAASFNNPFGVAVDTVGNVYVADAGNKKIRKISPNGVVTTIASSGFSYPCDIAVDNAGTLYVADSVARKIFKITTSQ